MSCQRCIFAQEAHDEYWYRWKNANVLVMGCREHVIEIFEVLSKEQAKKVAS